MIVCRVRSGGGGQEPKTSDSQPRISSGVGSRSSQRGSPRSSQRVFSRSTEESGPDPGPQNQAHVLVGGATCHTPQNARGVSGLTNWFQFPGFQHAAGKDVKPRAGRRYVSCVFSSFHDAVFLPFWSFSLSCMSFTVHSRCPRQQ